MLRERHLPAELRYKGNRRKRSLRLSPRHAEGRSLDSFKQLATSGRKQTKREPPPLGAPASEHLKYWSDAIDRRKRASSLHSGLMETLKGLAYREAYEAEQRWEKGEKAKRGRRGWTATKMLNRLDRCQSEFIAFQPTCCDGRAVAVPIGCNERLCPLCSAHRATHYRAKVLQMFERMDKPMLLTMTVPNWAELTRKELDELRIKTRAFLKKWCGFIDGGVYSLEITFNSRTLWHPHIHALIESKDKRSWIPKQEFKELKWRMEFDWFRLTHKPAKGERIWRSKHFIEWAGGRDKWGVLRGPGPGTHRRTLDLRNVEKSQQAASEVMKYMSKATCFINQPEALATFSKVVRGMRQINTFGSFYNVKLDEEPSVESHFDCPCGKKEFQHVGRFLFGAVELAPNGTWYLKHVSQHRQRCRGDSHNGGG